MANTFIIISQTQNTRSVVNFQKIIFLDIRDSCKYIQDEKKGYWLHKIINYFDVM